jgi:hypothetical protein
MELRVWCVQPGLARGQMAGWTNGNTLISAANGWCAEEGSALRIAEIGIPTQVSDDLTIVHGQVPEFRPAFAGEHVSDAFPTLVAFHFLALRLGELAYSETRNDLRGAIGSGQAASPWHRTERLLSASRQYRPIHLVGFDQGTPHLIIQVRLFSMLVWQVHFRVGVY